MSFEITLRSLLIFAAALVLGGWATLRLRVWLDRLRRRRISRRAVSGEVRARVWLGKNGFTILGEQETLSCTMRVDGREVDYELCADFLVSRNGERAIVEVKTGNAAQPSSPATRRQIFEYAAAFDVERAYMFDGDRSTLHEVSFQEFLPQRAPRTIRFAGWQVGFVCGALCAAAVAWWFMR